MSPNECSLSTDQAASTRVDKQTALALLAQHRTALGVSSDECMVCTVYRSLNDDVVFETPHAQVRLDRFACTYGHLLVVPKKHVEHTTELAWEEYQHLHALAYHACAVLTAELLPKRVFVASLGSSKALAQSFPHFHIHVVPVFADDESARPAHVLSWTSGVTIYDTQQAAALTQRLARAFYNQRGETSMATHTTTNVDQVQSVLREETHAAVNDVEQRNRGLRRWLAVALSLVAPSACSAGYADSYVPPAPTAPTSTTEQVVLAPTSQAVSSATPEILIDPRAPGSETIHPTLRNAMHENPAKPVVTGTLLVTNDGSTAFAADVDRHVIFQVNLTDRSVARFELEPDAEPGQMIEVPNGESGRSIFAVLRGQGGVLKLDPVTGQRDQIDVCVAPRGVTYNAASNRVYVACETGELVTVDPDSATVERTVLVAPDLRDVQVLGDSLIVSRYRSAEVLVLDQAGAVVSQSIPDWSPECAQSAVMHRLIARDSGVYMTHQMGTTGTLSTEGGGYAADTCGAGPMEPVLVVASDVTQLTGGPSVLTHLPEPMLSESQEIAPLISDAVASGAPNLAFGLMRRAGPVDLAVSPTGRIATSFTGDSLWPGANAVVAMTVTTDLDGYVTWSMDSHATTGMLTAVAFDGNDKWITQSREPAQLLFEDGSVVALDPTSAANTGLDLFYVNTGLGLSCAGCHPEGDEDGRTWAFPQGLRRTQALGGGIMSRAPFHWDGEMPEMNTLVGEVMLHRMGFMTPVTPEQVALFGRWMDTIPQSPARLSAVSDTAAPAVARGRELFNDATVGCATCHVGTALTDNKAYDVGTGGIYFTPTLLGIGLRNRFMHDGCATSLHERFGLCGGGDAHGKTAQLDAAQIDDLVTFMETL